MSKTLSPQEAARQDRLRAALRENLKRRKVQAKERAKEPTLGDADAPAELPDADGERPAKPDSLQTDGTASTERR